MTIARRDFWDAIDTAKRARHATDSSGCGTTPDDSSGNGGEANQHGDAPPSPAATFGMYTDMQIVAEHKHDAGTVLELRPVGHMSRRWLLIVGDYTITDISDAQQRPTWRNRRGPTTRDDDQAAIDLGDDMNEREREGRE